jgi:hypothetical protein
VITKIIEKIEKQNGNKNKKAENETKKTEIINLRR